MSNPQPTVGIYMSLLDMDARRLLPTRPFIDASVKGKNDRLYAAAKARGMRIVIVLEESYDGGNTFKSYWEPDGDQWVEHEESITVDLIFVKSVHMTETLDADARIACHREIERINDDKYAMYEFFSEFMAPCYRIDAHSWDEVMAKITTDLVVLKPVDGSCGEGIVIGKKSELSPADLLPTSPYLAQEFLDGSAGIPGIVEGHHDMRVIVYNGVPRIVNVRKAPAGSLLANVALGATLQALDFSEIPEAALDLVKAVDRKLAAYSPRIYTIDIMYAAGKPYLVEINTAPGFPIPEVHGQAYIDRFHQYLLDAFAEDMAAYANPAVL